MNIRLAEISDIQQLKEMYRKTALEMKKNGVDIWDDIYPSCCFRDDIENEAMYVVINKDEIVASFSLYEKNQGEPYIKWKEDCNEIYYLVRFAVNIDKLRHEIGSRAIKLINNLAVENGKKYLRLFVVDINIPAINFYIKNGFTKAEGIYEDNIDGIILKEYGYERRC